MSRGTEKLLDLPRSDEPKSDRQFVTALARGLEILRAFEPGAGMLGNQEIAERTGLPRPTVSRITLTLTKLGYLEYDRRFEKYSLGPPVLALGYACLSNIGILPVARPHMQGLADYASASVALGSRDRLQMTYIELCRGSVTVSLRLDVGARVPMQRSAMGMAFLAALPDTERSFLMDAIRKAEGKDWPALKKRLDLAFREVKERGFCASLGRFERTINGVGVPLVSRDGSTVYGLNCSGPSFQFTEDRLYGDLGPRLAATAENIRSDLARQRLHF